MNNKQEKPECKLIGENGNIFNLLAITCKTLRNHGLDDEAEELTSRIWGGDANSYYQALQIIQEYVDVI